MRNEQILERECWSLYRRVSGLVLIVKNKMTRNKVKFICQGTTPYKRVSSREKELSSLMEDKRAGAESQWEMTQDKVKLECQGATPWKTGIFMRGIVALFTGGWWAGVEAQREMAQDKVKFVCQGPAFWKSDIFLRGRIELFTEEWLSWCWVSKWDDAE